MSKKITQLPTASLVRPSDLLPIVDLNDTQTEKATFQTMVQGLDGLIATLTGSNFSGPIIATGGISGSLTKLSSGVSYLVAGANTFITTGSNGQVTITATGGTAAAGGSNTQLQYNNAAALDGIPGYTWDGAVLSMGVPVTASLGVSASFISLGTSQIPASGLVRIGTSGAVTPVINWYRPSGGTQYSVLRLDETGGTWYLGDGPGSLYGQLEAYNLTHNKWVNFVVQNQGTDQLVISNANAKFSLPVTASVGLSGSQGQFGVGAAMTNLGPTVASFNMPVTASLGMSASFWIHGGLPSTQGTFRLTTGDTFYTANSDGSADRVIFDTSSDNLHIGTDYATTAAKQFPIIGVYSTSGGNVYFGNGGTTRLRVNSNGITLYQASDPLIFGNSGAAATGLIRLPNNTFIKSNNNGGSADIPMLGTNTSDELFVGTDASYTDHAANVRIYANSNGAVYLGYGSTSAFYVDGNAGNVVSARPLTASAVSASYFNLNGSGNNLPSEGMLRVPYNQGVVDKVIVAMYSDDATNKNFLQYGAGNTWTIGNVDQNVYTDAYAIQTVAQSGAQSHYYNGNWNQYNYGRAAYDLQVNTTGWNLKTKPGGQAADRTTVGHRISLASGSAVTSSFASGSTLYMTPYLSNQISLFDGTDWWQYETGQVSISLSGLTANTNYDVFVYDNSGTITLELTAWTSDTLRATNLIDRDGVLVKSGAATRRYIGTIRTISTGTTTDTVDRRFVWNYYNRVARQFDVTMGSTWNYSSTTWRYAGSGNVVTGSNAVGVVCGAATQAAASIHSLVSCTNTSHMEVGVGIDNLTPVSRGAGLVNAGVYGYTSCRWDGLLETPGYHYIAWLEHGENATGTWYGQSSVRQVGMQGFILG